MARLGPVNAPQRDTIKHVLTVVVIGLVGTVANIMAVVTGAKDILAKGAIANIAAVQTALAARRPTVALEGSIAFATTAWFLLLAALVMAVLFLLSQRQAGGLGSQGQGDRQPADGPAGSEEPDRGARTAIGGRGFAPAGRTDGVSRTGSGVAGRRRI